MSSPNQQIDVELPPNLQISKPVFKKMLFLTNALEQGWTIKKSKDSYIFTKRHENKREIFQENYLETFVASNFSNNIGLPDFLHN